jgi:anti-sigma factor RsiW
MTTSWCTNLDGYLQKELSAEEQAIFVAHLETCSRCRRAVQEQEFLDQLLVRATTQLNLVPEALVDRIEQRLQKGRQRRLLLVLASLATAALVVFCVTAWWHTRSPALDLPAASSTALAPQSPQPTTPTDPRALVHVTFQPRHEVIAVPLKTTNPNVTLIWVYPTATPALPSQTPASDSVWPPERKDL